MRGNLNTTGPMCNIGCIPSPGMDTLVKVYWLSLYGAGRCVTPRRRYIIPLRLRTTNYCEKGTEWEEVEQDDRSLE